MIETVRGKDAPQPFLTARWRDLVMLNFSVDPAILASHCPVGTQLDTHMGRTFVSLVGFRFLDTRVLGVGVPLHRDFEEVNLRFYVRAHGEDGPKRGVVFVKEVVPRLAIAWIARRLYNEDYLARPMRSRIDRDARGGPTRIAYDWRHRGEWLSIAAEISGDPCPPEPGSEAAFISEHYWGYSTQRDGRTMEYRVEHPPWSVWRASDHVLRGDFEAFYGPELGAALAEPPTSAFVAEGSQVVVRRGRVLGPARGVGPAQ